MSTKKTKISTIRRLRSSSLTIRNVLHKRSMSTSAVGSQSSPPYFRSHRISVSDTSPLASSAIIGNRPKTRSLPTDCLFEIFRTFQCDYPTLFNCLLVCRSWAHAAVAFYWRMPLEHLKETLVIDNFLKCLNDEELCRFRKDVEWVDERQPAFKYTEHLRALSLGELFNAVQKWVDRIQQDPTLAQELSLRAWRIIVSHVMLISGIQSLSFDWGDKEIWREYPDLLRSLPSERSPFSSLQKLSLHYITDFTIFAHLSQSATNIEELEIIDYAFSPPPNYIEEQYLSSFIKSQTNLKRFKLFGHGCTPRKAITCLPSQYRTLTSLELIYIDFNGSDDMLGPIRWDGIAKCVNLQQLIIRYCSSATMDEHLYPLAHARFPLLRKIYIEESTYNWDELVISLIETNPTNLREVFFKPIENSRQDGNADNNNSSSYVDVHSTKIIETVARYCPDIVLLGAPIARSQIQHLAAIFKQSTCQLRSLSLFKSTQRTGVQIKDSWPELGFLMPSSMQHLNVCIEMPDEVMQQFLQSTRAKLETLWFDSWIVCYGYQCLIVHDYLRQQHKDLGLKQSVRQFLRYVV
ncbi:6003_t:CDS:2 [Paraglomus occultum]|uniref:6003_t:CDS:1 n=1 Tax=Paraglomus occultum TaxID=144539 RepID=A0A9N8Z184_9GLOM|nr:6003_t:CDS:2 [Paraglomus occultum]